MTSSHDNLEWLLQTTSSMLRCRRVAPLLDLAYDAIREGLGFDRVGLLLVDHDEDMLVERLGTDDQGRKFYSCDRSYPLDGSSYLARLLRDARMQADGPGYILQTSLPVEAQASLDGRPEEVLRVALRTGERVLGLISVDNLISRRSITPAHVSQLVTFANTLAVALENVSLLEERASRIASLNEDVRRHAADLEWLRDVSRRVNDAVTLDDVLDIVYDGIRYGLGYDRVGLVLFDWERELFIECRGTDEHGGKMLSVDRVFSLAPDSWIWEGPDMQALRRGEEFYYTDDMYRDTPEDQRYLLDGAPKHTLVVFLRSGDKITGLISVDNFVSSRPIGREQAPALIALANQVGTALERARLFERERTERARLEVLLDSARALSSTLDNDQILHELASRLVTALGATVAYFSHVDRLERYVRSVAARSAPAAGNTERRTDDRFARLEQVLAAGQPLAGCLDDGALPDDEVRYLRGHDLYAELLVPLVVQGSTLGVLEVYWSHPTPITPDVIDLCVAIGEQAAVAMDNARLYADAARRADCDPLTGLLNHRALLDRIDSAVRRGEVFTVLLMDVDDFKLFNDTHGHPVGDGVLLQVASTLREVCRGEDVAGRYGGDEFAVLLYGVGEQEASRVIFRLHDSVAAHPHVTADGIRIPLSVSIGRASFPSDGRTRQELIALADRAMYEAKGAHRSRWILHETFLDDANRSVRRAADVLGDTPFGVLEGLVASVDAKDHYTAEHSEDVTRLALLLSDALGLEPAQRRTLALAGPLHDVGKIAVPTRILRKPGPLTIPEYEAVKRHVAYGVALLRGVLEDEDVVEAVACHHERWDGTGYPAGRSGKRTPVTGRVLQIADAVSAMMLDRPYRQGMSWSQVVDELRAGAGSQFDPALVEPFVDAVSRVLEAETA